MVPSDSVTIVPLLSLHLASVSNFPASLGVTSSISTATCSTAAISTDRSMLPIVGNKMRLRLLKKIHQLRLLLWDWITCSSTDLRDLSICISELSFFFFSGWQVLIPLFMTHTRCFLGLECRNITDEFFWRGVYALRKEKNCNDASNDILSILWDKKKNLF